jgi:putative oxidoreductase
MKSMGRLVLRLVLGTIFAAHGYPKLFGGKGMGQQVPDQAKALLGDTFVSSMEQGGVQQTALWLESINVPNPQLSAWAIGLAEFGGGLALLSGVQARLAALVLVFSQLVAIRKVHLNQGLVNGFELNLSLIAGLLAIALRGPGKLLTMD